MLAAADQQEFEPAGPIRGLWVVDMLGCGVKGLPAFLHQPIEAVAANLGALKPAVGGKAGHRRAHHPTIDVERFEKLQQRSERSEERRVGKECRTRVLDY